MTLSPASSRNATVGEIVNLMSVDVQKCQDMCHFVNYMWSSPVIIVIAVYFLWQILGPATLAGIVFMLVLLPLNSMILAKKIREIQVRLFIQHIFLWQASVIFFVIISILYCGSCVLSLLSS